MVGRGTPAYAARVEKADVQSSGAVLEVRNLWLENPTPTPSREKLVAGVNFTVGQGEILGIADCSALVERRLCKSCFWPSPRHIQRGGQGEGQAGEDHQSGASKGSRYCDGDRRSEGRRTCPGRDNHRNVALPVTNTLCQLGIVRADKESGLAKSTMKNSMLLLTVQIKPWAR